MRKLYTLLAGVMVLCCATAMAQTKEITGKITDAQNGSPLAGVTVKVKGADRTSTVSQDDGTFSLTVPEAATTLIFSYVGYADSEMPVSNLMTVALQPGNKSLSEVVVVGYGTRIRRDVTSSISKISAKEFQDQPLPSFEQALQGRAAGVFINSGSGKLGQGLDIRVRGIASISAGSQPLIVIDGVPVTNSALGTDTEADNPLAALNPNDIESMEVLKDAASAAIYGARGSNGVILVTTKMGKAGKTRLNANVSHGWSDPTNKREFMNAAQYKDLLGTALKNANGFTTDEEVAQWWVDNVGTDDWNAGVDEKWSDRSFQKGFVNQYSVSMSGGDAKTKYLLSGGFNDQKGIILGNRLSRATGRLNLEHSVSDRLKLGANISLFRTNNARVVNDNAFANPIQLNALAPIQPAYLPDGSINRRTTYYNNLLDQKYASNTGVGFKTISSLFGELQLIPGMLMLRSQAGVDFNNYQEEQYNGRETQDGAPTGQGYNSQSTSYIFTSTTTLNFNKQLNDRHSFDAVTGIEYIKSNFDNVASTSQGFPDSRFTKLSSSANVIGGSSSETGYTFASYFLRGNYKFNDKYLLGASLRVDGSSRFGRDNRYGFFPAVSAGWIISDEDFLKSSNTISFLKLRTSYGKTGNAEIGNFASLTLVSATPYGDQSGLWINQLGNSDLTWEKTDQFDVGIDFGILNNRITGEVDYFYKNTQDLLLSVPLPAVNGYTIVTNNIGSMKNTGFEFVINSKNLIGEFKWNTSFNISTYKNEITKLVSPVTPSGRELGRLEVGQPFGQFYGYKYMGVDVNTGDALYLAKDGKNTVTWENMNDAGKFIIGDPNPDFYGGINNNFSYRNFDLDIQCQFVSGNDLFNVGGIFQSANGRYVDNQTVDQANYWKEPGQVTDIPKPIYGTPNGSESSSRWVEDGSYFRVKAINFGYTLPAKWINPVKLRSVRVYMTASNLFTFTGYSGYDPEVSSGEYGAGGYTTTLATGLNPLINLGHDWYTAPQIRTIAFGVNVGL